MDIALAVEKIQPASEYLGSVAMNTQEQWDNVVWSDERIPKPSWEELEEAWVEVEGVIGSLASRLRQDAYTIEADPYKNTALNYQLEAEAWDDAGNKENATKAWEKYKDALKKFLAVKIDIRNRYPD